MARKTLLSAFLLVAGLATLGGQAFAFDFQRELFGEPSSLGAFVAALDVYSGQVEINGVDTQAPAIPFTFTWGDGDVTDSFFPATHVYADRERNYRVTVTAHYSGGATDSAEALVRFVASTVQAVSLPTDLRVEIPNHVVTLDTRLYPPPTGLTYFEDSSFNLLSRAHAEYILTFAAKIQIQMANGSVVRPDGTFGQVVLRDPAAGGMYSLWFTTPVSFAGTDYAFAVTPAYSSLFHEMGHNVTLNSPASYIYGGHIDGNANAIYSETLAQIFQHATAYEILNHVSAFGLDEALATEIELSARSSMALVRNSYDAYVGSKSSFHSWNDPATPEDETFNTFMTVAYRFFVHAENAGLGYKTPASRMMRLLQQFDEELAREYDPQHDTPEAATFRSTLLVAAVSHAFSDDLRPEFRSLNFPIDDATYEALIAGARVPADVDGSGGPTPWTCRW